MKLQRQQLILSFVEGAKQAAAEKQDAEALELFEKALILAESMAGQNSPLVGQVLVELYEFLESRNESEKANLVWERVRHIISTAVKNS